MADYPYVYVWGNNPVRKKLKGKKCRVLVYGGKNSCLVEFEDGEQVNTSQRAIRRTKDATNDTM